MKEEKKLGYSAISLEDITEGMAEVLKMRSYKEIVTFDEMVKYAIEQKNKNFQIAAFIVSVKKNYDPRNENDKFIVVQGFLDANKKPVTLNGRDSESRIIHTRTIDKKFVDVLNGAETRIINL